MQKKPVPSFGDFETLKEEHIAVDNDFFISQKFYDLSPEEVSQLKLYIPVDSQSVCYLERYLVAFLFFS
jgi:hypothetical protein